MTLKDLLTYLKADLLRLAPTNPSFFSLMTHSLHPRFFPVFFVRVSRYFYCHKLFRFLSPIFTWFNVIIFGIEVTPKCDIGPGLMLPHTFGTVIGANKIGPNATIFQGSTIGASSLDIAFDINKRPVIGCHLIVGAGAKVLGDLTLGDNVTIGANSVVIKSVADAMVVAGIPAKIIGRNRC